MLVAVLLREPTSALARERIDSASVVTTASIAYVEARAAVAAARRARRISRSSDRDAVQLLHRRWREWQILQAEEPLVKAAGDVAEAFSLRAADALHLASALVVGDSAFATFDRDLSRAALDAGLDVLPN